MNPPLINHSDWTTGFDTSTNQRAYGDGTGNGFGNWKGLNLWTYYPVNIIQELLNVIAPVNQDLRITKTNTGVFTLGNNGGSFSIKVDNVGSALVAGSVSVTDPLPASLTPVSATGTGWTCSINGQDVSCTHPNAAGLAAGANLPIITITVNVSAAAAPSVTNMASLSNSNDGNPANNQFSDTVIVNVADLAVTKTDGVASVSAGGTTTYSLVVSNAGPSPADNAVFTDPAVAGLNVTSVTCSSVSGGAACPVGTNTTVNLMQGTGIVIPTLPSGSSVTFTVNATVTATSGSVANVVNVTPSAITNDPSLANNTATDTDTVTPAADLSITKTDGVVIVNTGAATTYTIRVTNNGPSSVTGALLSDPAATGLTKTTVACSAAPGQCVTAPTVVQLQSGTFALPALAAGQYYEITVAATVTAANGSVTNNASVAAPGGTTDPVPGNNTAADTDTVNPAQCVSGPFTSWAFTNNTTPTGSGTFTAGTDLTGPTYPIAANNGANNPVISYTNWPLTFAFLNNLQYLQFSVPTTGKYNIVMSFAHARPNNAGPTNFYAYYSTNGGTSWTQMTTGIAPNNTITTNPNPITSVTIDFSSVPALNNNANAVFRLYAYGATSTTNNGRWFVDTVSFSQNCGSADLAVTKTDSVTNVATNSATTYTLTLTNGGPGAANNATISDPAVTGLAKTSLGACTAAGGAACPAAGGGTGQLNMANLEAGTVSVPTLPNGGSISFAVTATVTAPGGSISNSFTALPPLLTNDPNFANNAAADTDTVVAINAINDVGSTINRVGPRYRTWW
jgi:uncharacterized repeat protein (TIGR01451 family)